MVEGVGSERTAFLGRSRLLCSLTSWNENKRLTETFQERERETSAEKTHEVLTNTRTSRGAYIRHGKRNNSALHSESPLIVPLSHEISALSTMRGTQKKEGDKKTKWHSCTLPCIGGKGGGGLSLRVWGRHRFWWLSPDGLDASERGRC